jgi:hypothetical protein
MKPFSQLFNPIAILVLCCLLQACSMSGVVYNQVPRIAYWQLDDYFDFSEAQTVQLREELQSWHQWHRATQLPVYADFLAGVRQQMPLAISPEQSCAVFNQATELLALAPQRSTRGLSKVFAELSDAQIAHAERKIAEANADWKKEWIDVSKEEMIALRYEQFVSRSETIYGSLNKEQKAEIRLMMTRSLFDPQRTYAERVARQNELLTALRSINAGKRSPDQAEQIVKSNLQNLFNPNSSDYRQKQREEGCNNFSRLHRLTTPAQRAKSVEVLKRYEDEFRKLAVQR